MALHIRNLAPVVLLALAAPLSPATAKVTSAATNGFSVVQIDTVEASPADVWAILIEPSLWWNPDHSFTGQSIYFTLDAWPGGCFCEKIPANETQGGGIRHFSVVYVDQPRVLRMQGGLGPLQSEAVAATMTIAMEPRDGGTAVSFTYVVGGYIRTPVPELARSLDQVTGEALARLKATAEGRDPATAAYVAESVPPRAQTAPAKSAANDERAAVPAQDETPVGDEAEASDAPAGDGEAPDDTPTEADAAVDAPRASLTERLELQLEEDEEVELAGSVGTDAESGSQGNEEPDDAASVDEAAADQAVGADPDELESENAASDGDDEKAPVRSLAPLPDGSR